MLINEYTEQYNNLTKTFLKQVMDHNRNENIVMSPYSIIVLLGMAAQATSSATRQEILNVIAPEMDFEDVEDLLDDIRMIFGLSKKLMTANAICIAHDLENAINPEYSKMLRAIFDGIIFTPNDMVADVNMWVKEHTRGMIDSIVDDSVIDSGTAACFLNAIAFEGEWEKVYKDSDIIWVDFNNADGSVKEVNALRSMENIYIKNSLFEGFVKPYKGKEYSYMALLPKKEGYAELERSIENINFSELYKNALCDEVRVIMPEFKCDYRQELKEYLEVLGIRKIFTKFADFSTIASAPLMAASVIHKAYIEVDRKGTKAAAATAMCVRYGCMPRYESVYLDRPFIYSIIHNKTGLPVFTGVVNHLE